MTTPKIPSYDSLMNPLLHALRSLGGSGSIEEIYEKVVEEERLPETLLSIVHDPEKSTQTEIAYRLAWARTYLKKYGFLENSSRGIWALTSASSGVEKVDPRDVVSMVRGLTRRPVGEGGDSKAASSDEVEEAAVEAEKQ